MSHVLSHTSNASIWSGYLDVAHREHCLRSVENTMNYSNGYQRWDGCVGVCVAHITAIARKAGKNCFCAESGSHSPFCPQTFHRRFWCHLPSIFNEDYFTFSHLTCYLYAWECIGMTYAASNIIFFSILKQNAGNFINYILFICSHTKHGSISKCIGRSFRSMGEMKKIRTLTHTQAYKKNCTLFLSFLKHAKIFHCWVYPVLAFLSPTLFFLLFLSRCFIYAPHKYQVIWEFPFKCLFIYYIYPDLIRSSEYYDIR